MVNVPIQKENVDFVRMDLSRHFSVVDCDFTCYLVLNPDSEVPLRGSDIAVINIGCWQINTWNMLSKKFYPNRAGFSACIVWDKTLVVDGVKAPQVIESDVDIADSVSSLKGQPVNITGFSLATGESLKVSTLADEFVNVKTVRGSSVSTYQQLYSVKVGEHFEVTDIIKEVMHESSTYNNGTGQVVLACSEIASNNYFVHDNTYDDGGNARATTDLRDFYISKAFSVGKHRHVGLDGTANITVKFNEGVVIPYQKTLRINIVDGIVQDIYINAFLCYHIYDSTQASWVNMYQSCEYCLKNRDNDTELLFRL